MNRFLNGRLLAILAIFILCSYDGLAQGIAGDPWKSCQSQDTDQRIRGCTVVIDQKGSGSTSRLADALDGRCWAYHVKQQYALALADCKASIALRPNYSYVYGNLGSTYLGLGDFQNALSALNKAIELKPNFLWTRLNRGRAFAALGRNSEALADFNIALAIDPQNGEVKDAIQRLPDGSLLAKTTMPAMPNATTSPSLSSLLPAAKSNSLGRRIALVIGNSSYKNAPVLTNPQNDAALIADALAKAGFNSVTLRLNLDRDAVVSELRQFAQQSETADWSVVYYAGHGMEVGGVNYLVPIDAKIATDRDIAFEAISLEQVLNAAERAKRLRLVVLDACRDNPFLNQMRRTMTTASRSVSRGLATIEPEAGTLVVYAAKDGETALDGAGANSPFALAFAKNLQTPGVEVRRMFDFVRDDVMESTQRRQKPFSYGSISGRDDFYFIAAK